MAKQRTFFKGIFLDAWKLTWKHKAAWIFGFIALFLSSSLSYQLIFQGIKALARPGLWLSRWQAWAQATSPLEFMRLQWVTLTNDPSGWFIMVLVWTAIIVVLLILFSVSVYAVTSLVSMAKIYGIEKEANTLWALKTAWPYFRSVFGLILLLQIVSNVLILLFSLPVIWLGVNPTGVNFAILLLFFASFLVLAYIISMVAMYALMSIVVEEYKLADALSNGWRLFKTYWFVTVEMFILQLAILFASVFALLLLVALIVIPLTIIGFILVSQELYDITAFLPHIVLYLLTLLGFAFGAAYSCFQLYSWANLFMNIEKIRPESRLARFIELRIIAR